MGKMKNLQGQRFGRLTVIEYAGKDKNCRALWKCKCDCGNETTVSSLLLLQNKTQSCGCLHTEQLKARSTKHGQRHTRLYRIWMHMKYRCSPAAKGIHRRRYYEKGIRVCEDWEKSFIDFYNWAMLEGYTDDLTIDRIDNNGDYEPSNCRWITQKAQCSNRETNQLFEYDGKVQTIMQWADEYGINYEKLRKRLIYSNWDIEKALTTP
ncbi:MAG: hypothetical protein ENTA_03295 [Enterocloster clostridioformis]|uniref:hypothetical protein n=1 Tax=Clostridium sp. FS41 TaxID=1609975 RepID=UPI0005D46513|nr:hypothetical protein [Clostridium sp. FS41]KJJ73828.1 hypothetical protein CLFS41_15640 [Clostridium sp. FS41]